MSDIRLRPPNRRLSMSDSEPDISCHWTPIDPALISINRGPGLLHCRSSNPTGSKSGKSQNGSTPTISHQFSGATVDGIGVRYGRCAVLIHSGAIIRAVVHRLISARCANQVYLFLATLEPPPQTTLLQAPREQTMETSRLPANSLNQVLGDPFDTPLFNQLLVLIKEQNVTAIAQRSALDNQREAMEEIKKTLEVHDDQPYEEKDIDDESTCTALFEIAMAKTKEEVDEWIKRMDVSLVFIALFSAVLTAFVIPATQNLLPSSNNTPGNATNFPLPTPSLSNQKICASYYIALIVAIMTAVLSVLGRQWMSKLINRPKGGTYQHRLLRHLSREQAIKRWLKYLVEGLHLMLLGSIGVFMTGLLYQLHALGGSFETEPTILIVTWWLGVCLSSVIFLVIAVTTSPVCGLLFMIIPKLISSISKALIKRLGDIGYWIDRWCDQRISWFPWYLISRVLASPVWLALHLIDRLICWCQGKSESPKRIKDRLVRVYTELIADASSPGLLERAVASFSYLEWIHSGKVSLDQLEKTFNRLMSTDTSIRVRETVTARVAQFVRKSAEHSSKIHDDLLLFLHKHYPLSIYFPALVLSCSFEKDNEDLRQLSSLPSHQSIARVLCSYNHPGKLGERQTLCSLAERHCAELILEGKSDEVVQLFSFINPPDLIKSYIQRPHDIRLDVVRFLVQGRKIEFLKEINHFLDSAVDDSRISPSSLSQILLLLIDPLPTTLDLSPLINYISHHPDSHTWHEISDAIGAYLGAFTVTKLHCQEAAHRFLQLCISSDDIHDEEGNPLVTSDETRARAHLLLAEIDTITPLPHTPSSDLGHDVQSRHPIQDVSFTPSASNAASPDLLEGRSKGRRDKGSLFEEKPSVHNVATSANSWPPGPSIGIHSEPSTHSESELVFVESPRLEKAWVHPDQ
ncbi:hypothetical protein SISNIDRAFT_518225 [Sistotremastrum niveocremeum HHB9708]|uniref:DUF6535 domain-containing protein n=1 Tax=Sistotremastrum niveocremeum HHB9708 TaxID=1314777 RepID=A0A164RTK6_9AGAM|nr:hypothetical protein SISNIDRAFT_518225 [Sistotremastrum niveocremeum HHB9708]